MKIFIKLFGCYSADFSIALPVLLISCPAPCNVLQAVVLRAAAVTSVTPIHFDTFFIILSKLVTKDKRSITSMVPSFFNNFTRRG